MDEDRGIERPSGRELVTTAAESVIAVAIASGAVAALQNSAPATGLGSIYLLAVLEVAIRRGEVAAMAAAVLSALTLNYFFITPRHQLTIAHSQDVVQLIVFLIVAVVVGRLAANGRRRAREAESRARIAAAREREASLLALAASAILAGQNLRAQLESLGSRVAAAVGASRARVVLEPVPRPGERELAISLRSTTRNAWLYVSDDLSWPPADLERISDPLGKLLDVALERERLAESIAET